MKKTMFVLLSALCFGLWAAEKPAHAPAHAHDHDHEEHDHEHEKHDHAGHDHGKHDHEHKEHGDHDHGHGHVKSVEVTEAIQKVMGLKTVHPEKRRLRSTVTLRAGAGRATNGCDAGGGAPDGSGETARAGEEGRGVVHG